MLRRILITVCCLILLVTGCSVSTENAPEGPAEPGQESTESRPLPQLATDEETVEFTSVTYDELPHPVQDLVLHTSARGVHYGDDVYVAAQGQRVMDVVLAVKQSGAREIRVVLSPSDVAGAARFQLRDDELWLPIVFYRDDGTILGRRKLLAAHDQGPRAGNTVYVRLYLPDAATGSLTPVRSPIPTRPAPNVLGVVLKELVAAGFLTHAPSVASLTVDGDVITIDLREELPITNQDPLHARLVITSLANALLEFYGLDGEVRFLVQGSPVLNQPARFDDTLVRYPVGRDALPQLPVADADLRALLAEQRTRTFDGRYAEDYAAALGDAFRTDPCRFINALSDLPLVEMTIICSFVTYSCGYFDLETCLETVLGLTLKYDLTDSELLASNALMAALLCGL